MYITESNRLDIKNGCILRLTKAPGRCADDLHKGIQSADGGVRCDSLKELASVSRDVTFAQEFINLDGHNLLVQIVEDSRESNQIMTHTLTGFMELMDHGIVSWENLSAVFIKKVLLPPPPPSPSRSPSPPPDCLSSRQIAGFVNSSSTDVSMQQVSLDILENMVLSSRQLFLQVKQEVTMERLVAHLQVANQQIQTKAMALLMALLQAAEDADRQVLVPVPVLVSMCCSCSLCSEAAAPCWQEASLRRSHTSLLLFQEMFAFLNKKNVRQYIYKVRHSAVLQRPSHGDGTLREGTPNIPQRPVCVCVQDIILSSSPVQDEMAHYLYVLQSVTLNHLEARMRTPLDCYSQDQRDALHGLRQAAFETDSENSLSHERRRSLCAKEFKKLGFSVRSRFCSEPVLTRCCYLITSCLFQNNSNPGQDLVRTPPGLLALDTMFYFATRYPDAYSRVSAWPAEDEDDEDDDVIAFHLLVILDVLQFVLENSSREDKHECPFARSSIQLTLILCEILRIGDARKLQRSNQHTTTRCGPLRSAETH
ncbi:hypothetical protein CCH79_00020883, partial [Gambusia affinis]